MTDNITTRIDTLEEKFAHQERMVDALNEVIIKQQAQLDRTEEQLRSFRDQLEAVYDRFSAGEDPPPPHY